MRKVLFGLFMALVFFGFVNTAMAQKGPLKIGLVDVEIILKELPEAIKADKEFTQLSKSYQDTIMKMQKDLEEKIANYQKQKAMMPADQQKKTEEELQAQQMNFMQYRDETFGQTGTLYQKRENYLQPIREKIRLAIEKVAKDEAISLVLEKNNPTILYAEEKFEITYRVLDEIKRGSGK